MGQRCVSNCVTLALTLLAPGLIAWSEIYRDVSVNFSCFSGPHSLESQSSWEPHVGISFSLTDGNYRYLEDFCHSCSAFNLPSELCLGCWEKWRHCSGSQETLLDSGVCSQGLLMFQLIPPLMCYSPNTTLFWTNNIYPAHLCLHLKAWIEHRESSPVSTGNFNVFLDVNLI